MARVKQGCCNAVGLVSSGAIAALCAAYGLSLLATMGLVVVHVLAVGMVQGIRGPENPS